jgi:hypothetical protein
MHIEESAKCLGSTIHRDGTDTADVDDAVGVVPGKLPTPDGQTNKLRQPPVHLPYLRTT